MKRKIIEDKRAKPTLMAAASNISFLFLGIVVYIDLDPKLNKEKEGTITVDTSNPFIFPIIVSAIVDVY
jgi:hypothetical protein